MVGKRGREMEEAAEERLHGKRRISASNNDGTQYYLYCVYTLLLLVLSFSLMVFEH